jgi:hypothetical protein
MMVARASTICNPSESTEGHPHSESGRFSWVRAAYVFERLSRDLWPRLYVLDVTRGTMYRPFDSQPHLRSILLPCAAIAGKGDMQQLGCGFGDSAHSKLPNRRSHDQDLTESCITTSMFITDFF